MSALPRRGLASLLFCALLALTLSGGARAEEAMDSRFRAAEDGQFDISGFIDQAYGFVPLVVPITEPAVGIGAVGAAVFIDKPATADTRAGFGRPNITAVGALGTENGTRGAFVADVRHWLDDRLKTVAVVMKSSVNLDFYGLGRVPELQDSPLAYTLGIELAMLQARYRLGQSPWWLGLGYTRANADVSFDAPAGTPGLPDFSKNSKIGGLLPVLSYDSRNSPFTPTAGSLLELGLGAFNKSLGSDSDFKRYSLTGIHYVPLSQSWNLGVLGSASALQGDAPFYMYPFVMMRGVPAMRYQGEQVAQLEAELRWQFWQRYSLVIFGGGGAARLDTGRAESKREVLAGGLGIRYELARKYGLHMGLDIARGPDGNAFYINFGSAWMRP
ncbi:BamA/TamA family outer membrane protein [Uliginosibacterium aquaticum]|uniref:BamA/TamA family outer membrane protein n=1 Tax=Uliginosibacterium aquaticum TaxID=2731212 RepID=A0ABX2ILL7_9RHOO|nr:BamA/TamA family outer membrane protein [Uliginosibacterium aquaticum]NSL55211.1 BamA/TamA family outer membrane protein [Uliginosibacterium aquaticum]